mgnify:CR=1 FL=1
MKVKQECPYCNQVKETVEWKETGEMVCLDCRTDLLEQEFNEA